MRIIIDIPGPRSVLRSWRWTGLLALVAALALVIARDAPAAFAAESITSPDLVGPIANSSLALDAAGNPVISYAAGGLKVLHCNDSNCAPGGDSITIPDFGGYTSLELDSSGNPVVSYFDGVNGDLKVLHCDDANCAVGGDSITSPDTAGIVGLYTSLELDSTGSPVVSYYDNSNGDLKVLHCNDVNCAGGDESIKNPDSGGNLGLDTSLTLDSSGNPVVSYYDSDNSDLKVLHCNDANCAAGGDSITSPDTAGLVGRYPSLELDAAGNPVISHWDITNNDVKVLHCDDANCAAGGDSSTSPETAGVIGLFTSLKLDSSGYPVVSYRGVGVVRVLHCNDANCAGVGDSVTTADVAMTEGTSLALDGSGNPVISYTNSLGAGLKVAHCNDANCSSSAKQLPIKITNVSQRVLPKTCFEIRNPSQVPYFEVCDNDFAGSPDLDPICLPDGVCSDDDPADGSIAIPITPGDYRVAESQVAPQHTADASVEGCTYPTPVGGDQCTVTFTNTPNTRPWHPWDITGGPGNTPDGVVRVQDILDVVNHYFDDKPLN